jgi:hypothetical protein
VIFLSIFELDKRKVHNQLWSNYAEYAIGLFCSLEYVVILVMIAYDFYDKTFPLVIPPIFMLHVRDCIESEALTFSHFIVPQC